MNDYYIYIYWRLDTSEPFYVGKGREERWKKLDRSYNPHFMNIINKYDVAVTIEKDNLNEQQAFYWEEKIIEELVFAYGFSINIQNNRGIENNFHLVNCTWGGEGCSGRKHTEKAKEKISKANSGENNYWYGKNPRDYMTEEAKKERDKKASESMKGKNNPMYGKKFNEKHREKISNKLKGREISEEQKKGMKERATGKSNPNAISVICLTTKRIFYTIEEGRKYYDIKGHSIIKECCDGKRKSAGKLPNNIKLVWKYLTWKHNKKYRIKKR